MKKFVLCFLFNLCFLGALVAAPINSTKGYGKLDWGSSVDSAKKAGFKLTPMTSESDKEFLSKMYSVDVEGYEVSTKDNQVSVLQFHYYMGRLFSVTEMLNLKDMNQKKLEARYGKFSDQGIIAVGQQYMDAKLGGNGKVAYLSITISLVNGNICTMMQDWNVYKNISFVGQSLSGNESGNIVGEFASMANKLLQEKANGGKASYAFLPFSTDYKNKLVENYVTDALTEAMFNTGAVKIFERENLEAILEEQKFQASGLVNEETAKSIGMLAGVDFVCYGTLKDIGDEFTVNARVIDVETGEICAMSRTNIKKDDYLQNQVQGAVGNTTKASKSVPTAKKTAQVSANNLWQVSSYRNEFDGFTSYTFTVKAATGEMLYVGYKKCDIEINSRVFAGIYWVESWRWNRGDSPDGTYDFKLENGSIINKKFEDRTKNYTDLSNENYFLFGWNSKEGARWWLNMLTQNNMITVRKNKLVRKFQTSGLIEKMAEVGISWEEIEAAMANEEF